MLPPSALLNFIAGVFAAASVNILTTAVTGSTLPLPQIGYAAAAWLVAAGATAIAAAVAESARQEAQLLITNRLDRHERREVYRESARQVRGRFSLLAAVALAAVAAAVPLTISLAPSLAGRPADVPSRPSATPVPSPSGGSAGQPRRSRSDLGATPPRGETPPGVTTGG